MGDIFIWLISFFIYIALIVLLVYQFLLFVIGAMDYEWSDLSIRLHSSRMAKQAIFNICCIHQATRVALSGMVLLMCLADLEFDYINPYDTASRVNKVVLPEFITQGVSCIFLLFTGHWFMSLLGIPYLLYNARLYTRREHLLDVTEIFNTLNQEKKKRLFKLGYMIMLLCLSLFWLLLCALDDE